VPDDYPTIQEAVDAALFGETVFVKAGTYYEQVLIGKQLTIQGENRNTTMVVGNGTGDNNNKVFYLNSDNVTVIGFKITNGYYGIYSINSDNSNIQDCEIFGNHIGLRANWDENNVVSNNEVHDNTGAGIWFDSMKSSIIENNIIYNNGEGIYVGYAANYNIVRNNIIENNTRGIRVGSNFCVTGNKVYHNDFFENTTQVETGNGHTIWDDGYPSGGNFWSDYTGEDVYKGTSQDLSGNDGIGDTPYMIYDACENITYDRYPQMDPLNTTNQPPSINADQSAVNVDEGQPAANSGSLNDPDQDVLTLTASVGTVIDNGDGSWSWSFAANDGPAESQTVTITADDGNGGIAEITFDLSVNNVAPAVDAVCVPIDPVLLGTPVYATADFTDPAGTNDDPYTCTVNYGDGGGDKLGTVDGFTCVGPDHNYAGPGVYVVSVTMTDKDGGSGSAESSEYTVIYEPTGGFVTGGGWINSPEGAYPADPTLTGKANFGFVSKYKKGATTPTGETEFQFKVADLNFHSDTYDWLVIAGAKAMYKGIGAINGTGNYGFMLSAIDEKLAPSTDVDLFRIKIWDKDNGDLVVYDNQMGAEEDSDPTTAIGGGSIVIHVPK